MHYDDGGLLRIKRADIVVQGVRDVPYRQPVIGVAYVDPGHGFQEQEPAGRRRGAGKWGGYTTPSKRSIYKITGAGRYV